MYSVTINFNYDERQAQTFKASTLPKLQDKLERQIRKDGVHNWDGATLGRPLEAHAHVTISFSESAPANYAWELDDRRNPYWHLDPHRNQNVEMGPMEEIFHAFIVLCLEFANLAGVWPTSVWST